MAKKIRDADSRDFPDPENYNQLHRTASLLIFVISFSQRERSGLLPGSILGGFDNFLCRNADLSRMNFLRHWKEKTMAWKEIPGLKGKVYVPDSPPESPRKHCCADCFSCQLCSDERCSLCLGCKGEGEKRLEPNPAKPEIRIPEHGEIPNE